MIFLASGTIPSREHHGNGSMFSELCAFFVRSLPDVSIFPVKYD